MESKSNDKQMPNSTTIFEEQKLSKQKANSVLKKAKEIEKDKLNNGYRYVPSADGKTFTLTKK